VVQNGAAAATTCAVSFSEAQNSAPFFLPVGLQMLYKIGANALQGTQTSTPLSVSALNLGGKNFTCQFMEGLVDLVNLHEAGRGTSPSLSLRFQPRPKSAFSRIH
jgi:hypothetical protein